VSSTRLLTLYAICDTFLRLQHFPLTMTSGHSRRPQRQWHRFLAKGFELSVGQQGVLVIAEVEVTQNPPKVDILLLRRDTAAWTPEQLALLPDGIRDCNAGHVLIEFKYTESLTVDAMGR